MSTADTSRVDQYHAASRDALHRLHALARSQSLPIRHDPSAWLSGHVEALQDAMATGSARYCSHLHSAGPQMVHAAVWAPGYLACHRCVDQLVPDHVEEVTCDRCRRTVTRIHPCAAALGPILLSFGLCRACHAVTMARTGEDHRS